MIMMLIMYLSEAVLLAVVKGQKMWMGVEERKRVEEKEMSVLVFLLPAGLLVTSNFLIATYGIPGLFLMLFIIPLTSRGLGIERRTSKAIMFVQGIMVIGLILV